MSSKAVYVVRHYSYNYYEFESLIGLAATKFGADRMARVNEHVGFGGHTITYSHVEHVWLGKEETPHFYIELMGVCND